MTRHLRDQRGFSLAELLVVTAVSGLLLAGLFVVQQQGQQAYVIGVNRVQAQQNARVALERMTRELRPATSVTTLATATDMTFVDQNGQTIRYALSGTTLNRTAGGTTTALIGGVQSLTMTYYSVYDVYSSTYTTTTNAALVKVIKISINTKTEEGAGAYSAGDQHAIMESTVTLRETVS